MKIKSVAEIILSVFLFCVTSYSQQSFENNLFNAENRLKFGNFLFNNADYLRAVGEFQSYLKIKNNDTVKFNLARSFQKMKRFNEAFDNFKSLFFSSEFEDEARIEYLKTVFQNGNLIFFRELCNSSTYRPFKYLRELDRLVNYSLLFGDETLPAKNEFIFPFAKSDSTEINKFYSGKLNPPLKDPTLAGILSAVLPGAGKIYTEKYGDGITSFILTGLLTYLAVDNFDAGHSTRGWIFSGLAAYFYAGNIYGSVASAQIYNAGVKFNFNNEVQLFLEKKNYFLPEFNF